MCCNGPSFRFRDVGQRGKTETGLPALACWTDALQPRVRVGRRYSSGAGLDVLIDPKYVGRVALRLDSRRQKCGCIASVIWNIGLWNTGARSGAVALAHHGSRTLKRLRC